MKTSKLLRVLEVSEEKKDKNGLPYKTITFTTPDKVRVKDLLTDKVSVVNTKSKTRVLNLFKYNYLEVSAIAKEKEVEVKKLKQEDLKDVSPDFGYDLQVGHQVEGSIETRPVLSYEIVNQETGEIRIAHFYTTVVLGNTEDSDFEQAVQREFTRSGRTIKSDIQESAPIQTEETHEEEPASEVYN